MAKSSRIEFPTARKVAGFEEGFVVIAPWTIDWSTAAGVEGLIEVTILELN